MIYMAGLQSEGMAFVQAVLSGMIVYWGYFCIRKLRRIVSHNLIAISIEDGLFWIATTIYLFVQIYHTSDGSIRWYFVLGLVFGAAVMWRSHNTIRKSAKKNKINKKY